MTISNKKTTLWNKDYTLVVLVNALVSIGFYFVQPFLTKYVTGLGFSLTIAGVIAGMFSIVSLICRPFTGVIADRISPKTILNVAIPLEAVAAFCYGLVPQIPWLVACRILHAIGFCFVGTVLIVYGSSFVPRERMGEGIGYLGMGNIVGTAIGPSLGLALANVLPHKYCFMVAGVVFFLGFLLLQLTSPITSEKKAGNKKINFSELISLKLIPLSFLNGLFSFSNGLITSYLALHAETVGIGAVGTYFTVLAVCLFIIRPVAGKLNDAKGLRFVAIPGYCMTICGLLLIANAKSLGMILFAAVFMAFGQGAAQPAFQTACVRSLPNEQRGIATSTYYIFADVFQGFGPMIGGALVTLVSSGLTEVSYQPLYTFAACVLGCGLLLFILYTGMQKKKGITY